MYEIYKNLLTILLKCFENKKEICYNKLDHERLDYKKGRYKNLKITDIRVRIVNNGNDKLKAVASITIDDELVVHDIKVINGKDGYFLSMPSRKTNEGEFKDIVHPIKTEVREMLKEKILKAYEEALANGNE